MFKKLLALVAFLYACAAFAAVDVNKAGAADLDGVKGIGPALSGKILDERKKGNFKDWSDFIDRVPGIGPSNAAKFSTNGLTVNGSGYKATTGATDDGKKAAPKKTKAEAAKPAASAPKS
jgi:competence protein ComEA